MGLLKFAGIEGVILDAVGTLIDPVPSVSAAYAQAALRQGVTIDRDEVRSRFRLQFSADEVDEQRGPLSTSEAVERRRWRKIVAACLPELPDPDRAFAELWDHFGDPASWRVFDDVGPTITALHDQGLKVCVASNFDARLRPVIQGLPALQAWAEPVVISSEVGFRKPHPQFYEAACHRLGLPGAKVLCVGDDLENDVRGPIRAGLQAVLIDRNGHFSNENARLDSLEDLAGVIAPRNPVAGVPVPFTVRGGK